MMKYRQLTQTQRYHRALRHIVAGFHPLCECTLQLLGIHQRHHSGQGVMARYASLKIAVLAKKIQLCVAKILYLVPSLGTTDHCTDRQEENIRTADALLPTPGGSRERSIDGA